ncbi:MAG: MFS transporter [Methanomicrobiaceae archaeon]|nr:MFS transporter [Methanomicrobiaceae archaeon]
MKGNDDRVPHVPGRDEADGDERRIFVVLFISVFSAMVGLGIIIPLLPFYAESLGATGIWIGVIFSGFAFSRAIFMPIVGALSDRRGRRCFILAGLSIYTLLSIAYISADSVILLTAVRIFHGFASAMVIPIAMAYAADFSPVGREGRYMGTFMISMFLGMGCGPLIGGVIQDLAGMDAVFLTMSFFSLIALLICILFLPEARGRRTETGSILKTLQNRIMRPVLFFRVMNAYAHGTFMVFFPILAAGAASAGAGLSSSEIGIIVSMSILTTAILQRTFGSLSDRFSKASLIIAGTLIGSAVLFVFPAMDGFALLLAGAILFGVGSGIAIPTSTSLVAIAGRETGQGAAMGAYNTAMSVGMITSPLIAGLLYDLFDITVVFVAGAIVSAASALIFYAMARRAGIQ